MAQPAPLPSSDPSPSYWLREPNSFLLGHRTTEQLPEYVQTVIIGSGLTGTSAARWLVDEAKGLLGADGGPVLMLEAREACSGATGRPTILNICVEKARAEIQECADLSAYIHENEIDCEFRQAPCLRGLWDAGVGSKVKEEFTSLQKSDPDLGKRLSLCSVGSDELCQAQVGPECESGILTADAASLSPYKLVAWTLKHLIEGGKLNLQTNTPVTHISPITDPSTPRIGVTKETKGTNGTTRARAGPAPRWKLHTSRGIVTATSVLLATNAYTSHLLAEFAGVLVPVRETMTAMAPLEGGARLPYSYSVSAYTDKESKVVSSGYLVQQPAHDHTSATGGGALLFGGGQQAASMPYVGEADDAVVDPAIVACLTAALPHALDLKQGGKPLELLMAWTGIFCDSRDKAPWVGAVPGWNGVWVCAGYSGHGMPAASGCARAVVQMMAAEQRGENAEQVNEALVAKGTLLRNMCIDEGRLERANRLPTVAMQRGVAH